MLATGLAFTVTPEVGTDVQPVLALVNTKLAVPGQLPGQYHWNLQLPLLNYCKYHLLERKQGLVICLNMNHKMALMETVGRAFPVLIATAVVITSIGGLSDQPPCLKGTGGLDKR